MSLRQLPNDILYGIRELLPYTEQRNLSTTNSTINKKILQRLRPQQINQETIAYRANQFQEKYKPQVVRSGFFYGFDNGMYQDPESDEDFAFSFHLAKTPCRLFYKDVGDRVLIHVLTASKKNSTLEEKIHVLYEFLFYLQYNYDVKDKNIELQISLESKSANPPIVLRAPSLEYLFYVNESFLLQKIRDRLLSTFDDYLLYVSDFFQDNPDELSSIVDLQSTHNRVKDVFDHLNNDEYNTYYNDSYSLTLCNDSNPPLCLWKRMVFSPDVFEKVSIEKTLASLPTQDELETIVAYVVATTLYDGLPRSIVVEFSVGLDLLRDLNNELAVHAYFENIDILKTPRGMESLALVLVERIETFKLYLLNRIITLPDDFSGSSTSQQ